MTTCRICFKHITPRHLIDVLFKSLVICFQCYQQFEWHHQLLRWEGFDLESFYDYGLVFQQRLRHYKTLGDVELAPVFLAYLTRYIQIKYFGYSMIFAPSHHDDILHRGFHHLESLVESISLPKYHPFMKTIPHRQGQQNYHDREKIQQVIALKPQTKIPKQVLLFDDVMTTGQTMLTMVKLIKHIPNIKIKILVLAKKKSNTYALQSRR